MQNGNAFAVLCVALLAAVASLGGADEIQQHRIADDFGDSLPNGAITRYGTIRFLHGAHVRALVYSPDGTTMASLGDDKIIRLWDADTGKELRQTTPHGKFTYRLAVSADGKVLATSGDDDSVHLWDFATARKFGQLDGHSAAVSAITFSPDGRWLVTGSADGTVRFWDYRSGKELHRLKGNTGKPHSLVFSADGRVLLRGCNQRADFWDPATGKPLEKLRIGSKDDSCVDISPDGKVVATTDGKRARLWDLNTGHHFIEIGAQNGDMSIVKFSPCGKFLVTAGWSDPLRIWDVANQSELSASEERWGTTTIAFSPDSKRMVSAGRDRRLHIWDTDKAELLSTGGSRHMGHFVIGNLIALREGDSIRLRDMTTGRDISRLELASKKYLYAVTATADQKHFFSVGPDQYVWRWDIPTGKLLGRTRTAGHFLPSIVCRPDGITMVAAAKAPKVCIIDATTGKEFQSFPAPDGETVLGAAFSCDGRYLACASIDRRMPQQDKTLRGTGSLKVYDLANGQVVKPCNRLRPALNSDLPFSPDERMLATIGNDGNLYLHEVITGSERIRLPQSKTRIVRAAFSPDSRLVAVGSLDGAVEIWDLLSAERVARFEGHRGGITSLRYAPDGATLISSSEDGTSLVWRLPDSARGLARELIALPGDRVGQLWSDLASNHAAKAYRSIWELSGAANETTSFLSDKLNAVPVADEKFITELINDLDHDEFARRDAAVAKLRKLGDSAAGSLRKALSGNPTTESRRVIETLLAEFAACWDEPVGERLRQMRAIEVLEKAGGKQSQALLKKLADGAPGDRLTEAARSALRGLAN